MKHFYITLFFIVSFFSVNVQAQSTFRIKIQTTTPNEQFTIPTIGTGYNYDVKWRDDYSSGSTTVIVSFIDGYTGNATRTYPTPGEYTISIRGDFPRIYFNNTGDKDKVISIEQWGDNQWTSMANAFDGCTNLVINATDTPDLSIVTDMSFMFQNTTNLEDLKDNIGNWNVGNVENMTGVFKSSGFNENINNWNVSEVKNMSSIFSGINIFNQPLDTWNTAKVEIFMNAFTRARAFDQSLATWDISNVNNMQNMLNDSGLSTLNYDRTLVGWATLDTAAGETQIPTDINLGAEGLTYCSGENARNTLTNLTNNWSITDAGLACDFTNAFITTWETTAVNESIIVPTTGTGYQYAVDWGDGMIESGFTGNATHSYTTVGTHTVKILGDFPRFASLVNSSNARKLRTIEQWGTIEWETMVQAFSNCENLDVTATDAPDLSQVTAMDQMFFGCRNLQSPDFSNWDTSSVTSMGWMFINANNFNGNITTWDIGNVTDFSLMLLGANKFNQDLSGWNIGEHTTNVISMNSMFARAGAFDQNLGTWDLQKVMDIDDMFDNTGLSIANYDATLIGWAENGTTPNDLALGADSLNYCMAEAARNTLTSAPYNWTITDAGLDCSDAFITTWKIDSANEEISIPVVGTGHDFDVDWGDGTITFNETEEAYHTYQNPGTYTIRVLRTFDQVRFNNNADSDKILSIENWGVITWQSMELAFNGCANLKLNATDSPDLSVVTNARRMFAGTSNFEDLQNIIGQWDTGNIENMNGMFTDSGFNENIGDWDVSKVKDFDGMFYVSPNFNQDLSTWDISEAITMRSFITTNSLATNSFTMENYDKTLKGWATLEAGETRIPRDVFLSVDLTRYCDAFLERDQLINDYGWKISDLGFGCAESKKFITTWQTISANETITIPTVGTEAYSYIIEWGDNTTEVVKIGASPSHTYTNARTYTIKITGDFPRIYFNNSGDKDKLLSVEQWGTNQWTSMESAFFGCSNLVLNASDTPDLSNVTDMNSAFAFTTGFIDNGEELGNWDLREVISIEAIFAYSSMNENINNWNVSNVENLSGAFLFASEFNQPLNNWVLTNATNISGIFNDAAKFNQPLNNWDVSGISSLSHIFNGAEDFNQPLDNWDVSNVSNFQLAFVDATAFNQSLANWDISNATNMAIMLRDSGLSQENYDATLIGWATLDTGETQIPSNIGLGAGGLTYCLGEAARNSLINTYNWSISEDSLVCSNLELAAKVYLQGAAINPNTGEESLMRDDLRVASLLSTTSPYADGLTCDTNVFNTTGSEAIVDWVWVELRDKSDNTSVLYSTSALLQRDGDIVAVDGTSSVTFAAVADNYFVAIKHRNHLGIMTTNTIAFSAMTTTVDFTNATNQITYGTNAQTTYGMPSGVSAMWAGDANGDGKINLIGGTNDTNTIRDTVLNDPINQAIQFYGFNVIGYNDSDVNLSGGTQIIGSNNDANLVRDNILNHPINTFIQFYGFNITEQLPEEVSTKRIKLDIALLAKMKVLKVNKNK